MRIISEAEFAAAIRLKLQNVAADIVTGPGRSGAVAAVYASHILGLPFVPYGATVPDNLPRVLIIDTAMQSGRTLRKAERKYAHARPQTMAIYNEPPRVRFWYEMTGTEL